jgi:glucose/arabinose dehydrogenase
MLVTERPGRMRIITRDGKLSQPIANVPRVVAGGQAGLLDVALDRDFANNHTIYFSFSAERGGLAAIGRAKLDGDTALSDVKIIFRERSRGGSNNHGSRIAQAPDGNLFVTLGDHFGPRDDAQNLSLDNGKIIRISPTGEIPQDNPFVGKEGARRKSGATAIVTRKASRSIPQPENYGSRNTARKAAMRSTSSRRARTTAGR